MGLYEKARNLVDAQIRTLLDPAQPAPEERLKALILEVDRYRRELLSSLSHHQNEEAYLDRRIDERSTALALWRARVELAKERGRDDLAREAETRASAIEVERGAIARARDLAHAAVANIRVSLERVERTLRLLRERRRAAQAAPGAPPGDARPAAPEAPGGAEPALAIDPVELEFQRLEHEEVAFHADRRREPDAPPPEAPPAPRTSER